MSIKIEQLSIGNWVQANGRAYKVLAITDVVKISRGEKEDWVNVYIGDLEPLPITPENLALIGWVFYKGKWRFDQWSGFIYEDRLILDSEEGSFRAIHKLQNWLI